MLKKIYKISVLLCMVLPLALARAETHVGNGYQYDETVWNKEGSPYILDADVNIRGGMSLTINEGVTVMSASTTDGVDPYTLGIKGGTLSVLGSDTEPVRFIGLGNIYVSYSDMIKIDNALLEGTGLDISSGTTSISNSKISGAQDAIWARSSVISIKNSEIVNNDNGIVSNLFTSGPLLAMSDENIGGEGNAFDNDPTQNIITVHNTVFENNQGYAIKNRTSNIIDAKDNWWGNVEGPGAKILGAIIADPWLMIDPRLTPVKPKCCSNVLFLPGFEASRLYHLEPNVLGTGLPGTMIKRGLWEPMSNNDVKKLSMNSQGSSTDPSIFTSDVIDTALGVSNIYAKFIAMMNGMVADKTINSWLPFAYDWRKDVSDVVQDGTAYSTTTKLLITEVERLAQTSKTGKVTIVSHSNGGLVAKMLGKELEKKGKSSLIDKVIFIAVPQLGTPQAIAGMLHGNDQSLGGGFVLSAGTARTFGLNVSGAYGLLPSEDFFSRFTDPIITLAGKAIGSYHAFTDFLTGVSDNRKQPSESDLKSPAVLRSNLLSKSQWLHQALDNWNFPTGVDVLSIVGWGSPTTSGIEYGKDSPILKKVFDGDQTVLSKSASSYDSPTLYFNQGLYNYNERKNLAHSTILESDSIRSAIASTIKSPSLLANALPAYMSTSEPNVADYPWMSSWITVSVHSPVDLDLYSSRGGHIGIVPIPGHEDSDIKMLDDTIGGSYDAIGDEKYITVPADDTYTVQLKGTGSGTFTFQVEKLDQNMNKVSETVYTDLPVTPLLVASATINATTTAIASPLNLDVDGNGTVDIKAGSSTTMSPLIHLDSMKIIVQSLKLKPAQEKNLLTKIDRIRTMLIKNKNDKAIKKIKTLIQKSENRHINPKKMTEADKKSISEMFTNLLDALEAN